MRRPHLRHLLIPNRCRSKRSIPKLSFRRCHVISNGIADINRKTRAFSIGTLVNSAYATLGFLNKMAFPSIFYSPLAFSCLFRQVLERRISLSSTELVIQIVLVRWAGLNLLTCAATLTAFLFLAFCQTKAEYWDISQNLREIEASREASRAPTGSGLGRRRLAKQAPSSDDGTQEAPIELERLHGRPIMYPSVLRHIRMTGGFKDDFSHSYLYIGVPVGIHATYSPMISMDRPSYKVLWNIRPQDQAIRGGKDLTLSHKLEECLRAQVSRNLSNYCQVRKRISTKMDIL